jgi:anti-anti-sigma factor
MNTITKTNQLALSQGLVSETAFIIKLSESSFGMVEGESLFNRVESWISTNMMRNNKDVPLLIVNMENVDFVDSEGLQKLMACLSLIQSQQSNLLLCSLKPSVRILFEITRIDQLIGIFANFDAAIAQFDMKLVAA